MAEERLVDLSVRAFSERLATGSPAPGGGSAVALAGALGATLAAMVARLTVGRQAYAEHEPEMQETLAQAERFRGQLLALVDADTVAYLNVMEAYRLPKSTPELDEARRSAIQEALLHTAELPLATVEACVQVLNLAAIATRHGNKNASSDGAVAALLAHTAPLGAARNVRINLEQIENREFCATVEMRVSGLIENGESALRRALEA